MNFVNRILLKTLLAVLLRLIKFQHHSGPINQACLSLTCTTTCWTPQTHSNGPPIIHNRNVLNIHKTDTQVRWCSWLSRQSNTGISGLTHWRSADRARLGSEFVAFCRAESKIHILRSFCSFPPAPSVNSYINVRLPTLLLSYARVSDRKPGR